MSSRRRTSKSRTRSGTSTPVPQPIRLTRSSSNLRISTPALSTPVRTFPPHVSGSPPNDLASTSSSILNVDMSDGILVPETDPEAEMDREASALGQMDTPAGDEESKKNLRAQLRRTLSKKPSDISTRVRKKGKATDISELSHVVLDLYPPRQYFVLTDAGKPVFTSISESDGVDLASTIGIMQALISVFLDEDDKLRCINAGSTRITYLLRPPLYYVCSSSWGEPESVTRFHLEYLHLQILSVVTAQQLRKMFERRTNFDLRRLLGGAEPFLHSMLNKLEWDLSMCMSSLHCLKLDPALRSRAAETLVPVTKMKDILYIILVARGRVVTLVRPKKHSIHPSDLHILMNTIHVPSISNNAASASWLPICLPKFNASGFVNAYVQFLRQEEEESTEDSQTPLSPTESQKSEINEGKPLIEERVPLDAISTGVGLICVSGEAEFDVIRAWGDSVSQKLENDGTLDALLNNLRSGLAEYSVSELGIPGLRHFVYKSRSHVQITAPVYDDPYDDIQERRRLITLYQVIHDSLHGKSGQERTLKLQYLKTEKESVMGWITQPFELYLALSPRLPKSAVIGAANAVAKWVKKEESKVFLRDAPVF